MIQFKNQLFVASCLSMLTTAMIFSVRADILGPVANQFHLSNEMVGWIVGSVFWGFTLGIFICGLIVDSFGMKRLHVLSGVLYILGILMIITAPNPNDNEIVQHVFSTASSSILYFGFLITGISQGIVEGVVNPLITTIYSDSKGKMLNRLHAWWPAGLIIGGLVSWIFGIWELSWQLKLAAVAVPAISYLAIIVSISYPKTERVLRQISTIEMYKQALNPKFVFLFALMWLTAATELGPDQWFGKIMAELIPNLGNHAILYLTYTAGLMFALRTFCAGIVQKISPFLLLTVCSILTALGLFCLGTKPQLNIGSIYWALLGATMFGVGKTFFWPTMLGITSELFPKGGAFLINLMGGGGMLSVMLVLPLIGSVIDSEDVSAALRKLAVLPIVLTISFLALYFFQQSGSESKSVVARNKKVGGKK
ncbi:MFS transporter [Undibacterium curvum]|uniref:MFS transporter n=1 Tax=Undibacterium curvum TaxID=2762294 RepID=UPI003D0DDE0E